MNTVVRWWPKRSRIVSTATTWAHGAMMDDPWIVWIAYFGSYATLEYGYGSDLDLVVVIDGPPHTLDEPYLFAPDLPVPADVLVYNLDQWRHMAETGNVFYRTISQEAVTLAGHSPQHT